MEVNNFKNIESLLDFRPGRNDEQVCYIIQLIKRRKDKGNENMESGARIIKNILVCNLDQFHTREEEIIRECNFHNCRAYISVHPKSQVSIAKIYTKTMLDMLLDGNKEFHFNRLLESSVGKTGACSVKVGDTPLTSPRTKWIVDVDTKDEKEISEISEVIKQLLKEIYWDYTDDFIRINPTLNGVHLITPPFNSGIFKQKYPLIDIHKNNDTLLYFNSKE